jgi:hypothetical protein
MNVFNDFITCTSLLAPVGIRISVRNCRDFNTRSFAPNSALRFWKPLVVEFLLCILENFLCSVSALAKIALLLDGLQLLFVRTSTCLESKLFILINFCNLYFLIIKTVNVFVINVCIFSSHHGYLDCTN